jgi:hypothetical protein
MAHKKPTGWKKQPKRHSKAYYKGAKRKAFDIDPKSLEHIRITDFDKNDYSRALVSTRYGSGMTAEQVEQALESLSQLEGVEISSGYVHDKPEDKEEKTFQEIVINIQVSSPLREQVGSIWGAFPRAYTDGTTGMRLYGRAKNRMERNRIENVINKYAKY